MIKKIINNDIVKRALKTFIQGFLASLILSINSITNWDEKVIKSVLIGALAAGLSALMNFILNLLNKGDE